MKNLLTTTIIILTTSFGIAAEVGIRIHHVQADGSATGQACIIKKRVRSAGAAEHRMSEPLRGGLITQNSGVQKIHSLKTRMQVRTTKGSFFLFAFAAIIKAPTPEAPTAEASAAFWPICPVRT